MTTRVLRSIKGYRLRVTALSECGDPIVSEGCSTVVSDGFIRVTLTGEYDSGPTYQARDIFGRLCINDRDPDQMTSCGVEMELCAVNPDILQLVAGEQPLLIDGEAHGTIFGGERNWSAFALEVWTKAVGDSCDGKWGYFVAPFVRRGRLDGGFTIENGTLTVSLRGDGSAAPATWATTPYDDNPLGVSFPAGSLFAQGITTVQPPALVDLSLCPDRLLGGGVFWIDACESATV